MYNELKEMIADANFGEAEILFNKMSANEQTDSLVILANELESLVVYSFVCYMLCKNENAYLHELAAQVLIDMCWIEGAYKSAYSHAKRIMELEPDDIKNKEFLLFFYDLPEKIMDKEQAQELAKQILNVDCNNKTALKIIES